MKNILVQHPEIEANAIEALEKLGIKPTECLIIEDNENGIKAAKDSGAWVMTVEDVFDVNYDDIHQELDRCEGRTK